MSEYAQSLVFRIVNKGGVAENFTENVTFSLLLISPLVIFFLC